MIKCAICDKKLTPEDRIIAFGEFKPTEYDWKWADQYDEFEEIIPETEGWFMAHYEHFFKEKDK